MASIETQITALLLPAGFRPRVCGRLCRALIPGPPGTLSVMWVRADGSVAGAATAACPPAQDEIVGGGRREVAVFGALRVDGHRWLVALVTADEGWFHGVYTDARLLRQLPGDAPEPLRTVLTAELIVLR